MVYSIHGYSMVMDVGNINFSMIIRIIALVGIKRASLFSYVVYTVCSLVNSFELLRIACGDGECGAMQTHLQCTTMGTSETLASLTWYSMRIRDVGYFGTP